MSYDTWLESAHLDASERADDEEIKLDEQAREILKDPTLLDELLFEKTDEDEQFYFVMTLVRALNTGSLKELRHVLYHTARDNLESE